jgi:hypothetical protein
MSVGECRVRVQIDFISFVSENISIHYVFLCNVVLISISVFGLRGRL